MRSHRPTLLEHALTLVAGLLVFKVTLGVIAQYTNYFPPDFNSDFLRGRERYFWNAYHWAFYTHILSGPVVLVVGLFLVSERSRRRAPKWHRRLGWLQVACVLGLVAPSGLVMAWHAAAGPVAAVGLAALAVATAACAIRGAWTAARRRFADHRRWMWRCYLLLCSAVVLRLIGGLATVTGVAPAWLDPLATWMCWLVPLAAFELRETTQRGDGGFSLERPRAQPAQSHGGTRSV